MRYLKTEETERYPGIAPGLEMQARWSGAGQMVLGMLGFGAATLLYANFAPALHHRACALRDDGTSLVSAGTVEDAAAPEKGNAPKIVISMLAGLLPDLAGSHGLIVLRKRWDRQTHRERPAGK